MPPGFADRRQPYGMEVNMRSQLPERPSLEHLKNQAKKLLSEFKAGEPEAQQRFQNFRLMNPALSQAQLVIAREYGFLSWARLKKYVDEVNCSRDEAAKKLVKVTLL